MQLTPPRRFIMRIALFLLVVAGIATVLSPAILPFFMANPVLNGVIIGVIIIGIVLNVREVITLGPELHWIERFQSNPPPINANIKRTPAPVANGYDAERA